MRHEVTVLWICGIICVAMNCESQGLCMYQLQGIGAYELSGVARFNILVALVLS